MAKDKVVQVVDSDSDSDAPEVVSLSSSKKQAEDLKKKEVRNQIDINTQRNQKKRKREELRQARRKAILPKDLLVSLAEKEKQEGQQQPEEYEYSDSEEDEEEQAPPPKKPAVSKLVDGIEVQVQKEAYKKTVVNNSAKDFLQEHFYGSRVYRPSHDPNIVRNGLFAKKI